MRLTHRSPVVEILDAFRHGSHAVARTLSEIKAKGLTVLPVAGSGTLPQRLRDAYAEVRPEAGMTRSQFKQALKELE